MFEGLVNRSSRWVLHLYVLEMVNASSAVITKVAESTKVGKVGDIPSCRCKAMSLSLTSISPDNSPIALANIVYFSAAALVAVIKCHARREDDYASANAHSSPASCIGMVHYAYTLDQANISITFLRHKYSLFCLLCHSPIAFTYPLLQHGLQRPSLSSSQRTGLSLPARHKGSSPQPRHDAGR